jgi:hypothetical protein
MNAIIAHFKAVCLLPAKQHRHYFGVMELSKLFVYAL